MTGVQTCALPIWLVDSTVFRRFTRRKTVLSTNLPMEELERRYGEAASSRIRGEYQMLRFFGEDIRVLKRDR